MLSMIDDVVYVMLDEVNDLHDCIVNDFSHMTEQKIERAVLIDVAKASGLMRAIRISLLESGVPLSEPLVK